MTRITITEEQGWAKIKIAGHALYNPGNDIVCAAISALAGVLAGICEQIDGATIERYESGVCIFYMPRDYAIRAIEECFRQMEEQFPKNIKLKIPNG